QLVLRVRVSDMRTSALFRSLMASKPLFASEMAPIERFASEAGIDLGRDVDLAWVGTDGRERGASVAILTGRLDREALGGALEKKAARTSPYADVRLYALPARADTTATIWSAAGGRAVSEKVRTGWSSGQLGGEDFAAIETLVAAFRIAGDLRIDSEAKASDEDADALALTLKGLIAVSGLRASVSDPSLAEVLKGIRVDR